VIFQDIEFIQYSLKIQIKVIQSIKYLQYNLNIQIIKVKII